RVLVRDEAREARLAVHEVVGERRVRVAGAALRHHLRDFLGIAVFGGVPHGVAARLGVEAVAGDAALLAVAPLAVGYGRGIFLEGLLVFVLEVTLVGARVD